MPADIICMEPNSISEIPTAKNVIPSLIGLLTLERTDNPSVVGIQAVNLRKTFEPTLISFWPLKTPRGSSRLAFSAGKTPDRNTTTIVGATTAAYSENVISLSTIGTPTMP